MSSVSHTPTSQQVSVTDYPATSRQSTVSSIRQAGLIVLLVLFGIMIPIIGVYLKVHIDTQRQFNFAHTQLNRAAEYNLPTHHVFAHKINEKQSQILPITSFDGLYSLQADAQLIQQEIDAAILTHQKTVYMNNLDTFKTTLSNTEILSIPSYAIMKNVYLDASSKPLERMQLSEIQSNITSLSGYQKQLETELDEAQVELLYAGLHESKNDVENIRTFLANRGDFGEENAQLDLYINTVDNLLTLRSKVNTTADALENKITTEITPILDLPKSTKNRIEEEEFAVVKQKAETEANRRSQRGLPTAPAAPIEDEKVIFISTANQEIYLYEKGQMIHSDFTVTGKPGFETVRGKFAIYAKRRNAVLRSPFEDIEYEVPVAYWMPFYNGYGLHDATWRPPSTFGGNTYTWNGSHGCANLQLDMAAYIWDWAPIGTPVVVH